VFQTSPEGIVVTDADNKIIATNPSFTTITQYEAHEVVGQDPKLLSSGQHGKEFFSAMWSDILTRGDWQGEIVNRRKNGENFSEWLTINTVRDENNAVIVRGRAVGEMTFGGKGAGSLPTAAAVLSDVIELAASDRRPVAERIPSSMNLT